MALFSIVRKTRGCVLGKFILDLCIVGIFDLYDFLFWITHDDG